MLGYVRINKGELKVKEYELYRGLYCSLCRALRKEYGLLSTLVLSYDVTFLVLVLLSISDISPEFRAARCPFNPVKKCNYCLNGAEKFSYSAAVSIILFYFKIRDNISDSSFFKRIFAYLVLPYAVRKYNKAAKKFPSLALEISVLMDEQRSVEEKNCSSVDEAADASAKALGLIFSYLNGEIPLLKDFGYAVGRWVYLVDAADDICDDIKNKSFNVFVNRFKLESESDITDEVKKEIENSLNLSLASAVDFCERLGFNFLLPIIENVLIDGTESVVNKVLHGESSK